MIRYLQVIIYTQKTHFTTYLPHIYLYLDVSYILQGNNSGIITKYFTVIIYCKYLLDYLW